MNIPVRYPTLVWTAIVAAVFSLIVGLLMTLDFVGRGKYELFDTPAYLDLKQQLKDQPGDRAATAGDSRAGSPPAGHVFP